MNALSGNLFKLCRVFEAQIMTTTFTFFKASRAIPPLKRIPFLDPAPIPEKNASGTLKTRAHGQLITRKVSAV